MESKKEQLITEVVYRGNHTYEIKKTIDGFKGDKAILIGLYPTVDGASFTKIDNFEYITQAVNTAGEYKLIIAYGSSHSRNKTTNTLKKNLLEAISNSKAKDRVYQISSEYIDTIGSDPTHVLY